MRVAGLCILLLSCHLLKGQRQDSLRQQPDSLRVLSFDEFYVLVLDHHPVVKQARLLPQQAARQLRLARGSFDPKLKGSFDFKEFDSKTYYNKFDASLEVPTWFPVNPKVGFQQNSGLYLDPENFISDATDNRQLYLGVSVPLGQGLFIDRRRATVRKALLFQDMAQADQIKEINKILLTAAKDYWQWYYAYNTYVLMQQSIILAQDIFDRTKALFDYGEVAAIDTVQAKITLLGRITAMQQADMDRLEAAFTLSNHLWTPEGVPLEIMTTTRPDSIVSVELPDDILSQLVAMARENHPEIRKLAIKNEALNVDRQLAAENLKPELNLNYSILDQPFDTQGNEADIVLDDNYKVGIEFAFPVLLRKQRAKLQQTKLKITDNTLERNYAERRIINEINSQYYKVRITAQMAEQQYLMVEGYRRILQAERLNLANGESDLFKLNIQIDKLIEAQTKWLKLQSEYQKSIAILYWAAGITNLNGSY